MWIILNANIGKETKVEQCLKDKFLDIIESTWLPRYTKKTNRRLVITGYVFVKMLKKKFKRERFENIPDVNGVLGSDSCFILQNEEVKQFMNEINKLETGVVNRKCIFRKNDIVKIKNELFNNLWGKILSIESRKGKCIVGVKALKGMLKIEVDLLDLVPSGEIG